MNKKIIGIVVGVIAVIAIGVGVVFALNKPKTEEPQPEPEPTPEPVKQIDIYKGNDRPIAVMIDNHFNALPQAGLNDAYIVYEITVEGGESRLLALFKGQNLDKIGPIRSARHYFLDYALENDALFVHYGWSPQAQRDIPKLKVDNVHGMEIGSPDFSRADDKISPHDVVTTTDIILKNAKELGYRTDSNSESVLNYVEKKDEVTLADGKDCTEIDLPYKSTDVRYEYDSATKRYTRYSKGDVQKDWRTDEKVTVKNIIVTFAENTAIGDDKDRQELDNVGKLKGYYITNGKLVEITCEKKARDQKTVYKDKEGNVLNVNDGNTFIQIVPIDSAVKFQ